MSCLRADGTEEELERRVGRESLRDLNGVEVNLRHGPRDVVDGEVDAAVVSIFLIILSIFRLVNDVVDDVVDDVAADPPSLLTSTSAPPSLASTLLIS